MPDIFFSLVQIILKHPVKYKFRGHKKTRNVNKINGKRDSGAEGEQKKKK